MEAGQSRHSPYNLCPRPADPELRGGNSSNWNLNGWDWNPLTFKATRLNVEPSDRSRQLFPAGPENPNNVGFQEASSSVHVVESVHGKDKRKVVDDEEEEEERDDDGKCLSLKLGGPVYSTKSAETKSGKKTKYVGYSPTGVVCQVEGCKADLSSTKDYLRRHKVCEIHSKARSVMVGGVLKRFCQQCSRFQELQEFDKEKRSCIRRLEGHNKRRRKTHPDPVATGEPALIEQERNSLLISVLRILANIQVNPQDQNKVQDLLSQLLRNFAGTSAEQRVAALMQQLKNEGTPIGTQNQVSPLTAPSGSGVAKPSGSNSVMGKSSSMLPNEQDLTLPSSSMMQNTNGISMNTESALEKQLVDIDLNRAQDFVEDVQLSHDPNLANGSVDIPKQGEKDPQKAPSSCGVPDSRRSTPPSSSNSTGEAAKIESCTDRILIKLFEKTPEDMPRNLLRKIFFWLHNRPTEVESYIRPGCIILTIYLRLENSMWEELCNDLASALKRLLGTSIDSFWQRGWICIKIRHSIAIAYDGEVIVDGSFPSRNHENCSIALIKPIAVSVSKHAKFLVKGFNLWSSTSRILCNMHGKCLVEQSCHNPIDGAKSGDITNLSVHCPIPDITGRGFVEVEDEGLRGNSFPFIVAEEEVCSEIRTLETTIDSNEHESPPKDEAMNFLHEMGWLLQRSNLIRRANHDHDLFPFERFRWLMNFAVENDWCAVVKKLLDILFDGVIDLKDHGSVKQVVFDLCLLHKAVRRNCRDMVELLLEYVVEECSSCDQWFVFKPDEVGPLGLTPLHLAANNVGSEEVLDALTDDPGLVGLEAWNTAEDSMGLTPNDYASLKHHHSYIDLVQSKLNGRRKPYSPQLILDIPQSIIVLPGTRTTLETNNTQCGSVRGLCELCEHGNRAPYRTTRSCLTYRPALISVLFVGALCVCVALLFRGSPEVIYIFRPFRWEMLKYGTV